MKIQTECCQCDKSLIESQNDWNTDNMYNPYCLKQECQEVREQALIEMPINED